MAILWCGGEDIDFGSGPHALTTTTSAGYFRSAWARGAVYQGTLDNYSKSNPFAAGSVTSCWLSCRFRIQTIYAINKQGIGLTLNGAGALKGLFVGSGDGGTGSCTLRKYDGATYTTLASETGNSIVSGVVNRLDMRVINYGSPSCQVYCYIAGVQVISYTGDASVSGVSALDCAIVGCSTANTGWYLSEIIVSAENTQPIVGLKTLALTGAGTTDDWTGTYSDINGTSYSDTSPAYTNTAAKNEQFNITDLPAGSFDIRAVKVTARAAKSGDATPTQIALGYNNGGVVAVGDNKPLTTAYESYEQLSLTDPTKSANWSQADINALQFNVQSVA